MAGSKAFFAFDQCIDDYLVPHSPEADGCQAFADNEELNVNTPEGKAQLRGVCSGLRKIADGIERDGHLLKRVTGKR